LIPQITKPTSHLLDAIDSVGGHHADALALGQRAIDHPHQHHDANVVVEPGVDDHGPRRPVRVSPRGGHARDHGLEDLIDAFAGLGRAGNGVAGIDADHILDFGLGVFRIGLRQVHLVQHRHDFDVQLEGGVAIGHRLRLDALAGVDHQQRALTGRQ
jgi:hypothetical protein